MFDDYFGIPSEQSSKDLKHWSVFPAPLKHTLESLPINKFKVAAFFTAVCRNYLTPQHSREMPEQQFDVFFSFSCVFEQAKRSENKTNGKLLFTIDPEKQNRTEMTMASENLWETEREKFFLFLKVYWMLRKCPEKEKRVNRFVENRTDSLLWEFWERKLRIFPAFWFEREKNYFERKLFKIPLEC